MSAPRASTRAAARAQNLAAMIPSCKGPPSSITTTAAEQVKRA